MAIAKKIVVDASNPPYRASFGVDPPLLVGRDTLVADALDGVWGGPGHTLFGMGFVGDRGLGKTVLLNRIEQRAQDELGWPVVRHQVVPGEAFLPALCERLADEATSRWAKAKAFVEETQRDFEAVVRLGIVAAKTSVSVAPRTRTSPSLALERLFRRIAEQAKSDQGGFLLTIDEAHGIDKQGFGALSAAMQTVVNRGRLPVAVILAGLPELRSKMRDGGTFFQRMTVRDLDYLSNDSARLALLRPASERSVTYDPAALELLVGRAGGYPYFVQLLGFEAWRAAGGRTRIELADAEKGCERASKQVEAIYVSRWEALSELERDFVYVVAKSGGTTRLVVVTEALGRTAQQLASTRRALIAEHHLLVPVRYGEVRIGLPGLGAWLAAQERVVSSAPRQVRPGQSQRP